MMSYPVFSSNYFQRGYGSVEFWRRTVKPLLKRIGLKALRHGAKFGARVAHDVAGGQKMKDSLKRRAKQTVSELASESNKSLSGRPNPSKAKSLSHGKRRKTARDSDIFD